MTDPLRRYPYGTDASCYRMVPRVVVRTPDFQESSALPKPTEDAWHMFPVLNLGRHFVPICAFLIALMFNPFISDANAQSPKACSERQVQTDLGASRAENEVMRTQNFILHELNNNRADCAKTVARNSDLDQFRNYFISLAHYFDYGDPHSNLTALQVLDDFRYQEKDCQLIISDVLGALNHSDCATHTLMRSFLLLEMDNICLHRKPRPEVQDKPVVEHLDARVGNVPGESVGAFS